MEATLFRTSTVFLFALALCGAAVSGAKAATFFVKGSSPSCAAQLTSPGGNGSSWSKAFNNLDSALNAARTLGGTNLIMVAKGTYKPCIPYGGGYTGTEPNLVTFNIPSNTTIVGGCNGTETSSSQCASSTPTILNGDINGDDINDPLNLHTNKTDNAWHVVTADHVVGVVLKNLTIQGGYAAGPDKGTIGPRPELAITSVDYLHTGGGGLLSSNASKMTLTDVKFLYNGAVGGDLATLRAGPANTPNAAGGAGIAAFGEGTDLRIKNSFFDYNTVIGVGANGGAINMFGEESFLRVEYSQFTNNTSYRSGGGIRVKDADVSIIGSLFRNNGVAGTAIGDESGGGVSAINSQLTVSGSVFQKNFVTGIGIGGGLLFHTPFDTGEPYELQVKNSLFDSNIGGLQGGGGLAITGNNVNPGSNASVTNSVFINNFGWMGGGVLADSLPIQISNTLFYKNKAALFGGGVLASNFSNMIRVAQSSVHSITNSIFKENTIVPIPPAFPPFAGFPPGLPTDIGTVTFLENILLGIFSQAFAVGILPPAQFLAPISLGGAGIAVEYGSTLNVSNTSFIKNSAPGGNGGGILVWGTYGMAPGANAAVFNSNVVTLSNISCDQNTALNGDNALLLDPPVGLLPPGTYSTLTTDGSCP